MANGHASVDCDVCDGCCQHDVLLVALNLGTEAGSHPSRFPSSKRIPSSLQAIHPVTPFILLYSPIQLSHRAMISSRHNREEHAWIPPQ